MESYIYYTVIRTWSQYQVNRCKGVRKSKVSDKTTVQLLAFKG